MSNSDTLQRPAFKPASAEQSDAILDVTESLVKSGCNHLITVSTPTPGVEQYQDGVYVTGYRRAGLDRCAFVADAGEVTWLR